MSRDSLGISGDEILVNKTINVDVVAAVGVVVVAPRIAYGSICVTPAGLARVPLARAENGAQAAVAKRWASVWRMGPLRRRYLVPPFRRAKQLLNFPAEGVSYLHRAMVPDIGGSK
jgi:hypothetical protein